MPDTHPVDCVLGRLLNTLDNVQPQGAPERAVYGVVVVDSEQARVVHVLNSPAFSFAIIALHRTDGVSAVLCSVPSRSILYLDRGPNPFRHRLTRFRLRLGLGAVGGCDDAGVANLEDGSLLPLELEGHSSWVDGSAVRQWQSHLHHQFPGFQP